MKIKNIFLLLLGALVAGCVTNYEDVPGGSPHATIRIEGSRGLFGAQTITPLFVNSVAANSRSNQRVIRVPPGKVDLVLLWDHSFAAPVTKAEVHITFEAEAGKQYFISGLEEAESFTFDVRDEANARLVTQKAPKQTAEYRPFVP